MAEGFYVFIIFVAFILAIVNRKLLLYYFVFLYPILPEYLAINISESLPLITASRALLLILILSCIIEGKIRITIQPIKDAKMILPFFAFWLIETVELFVHIGNSGNMKTYFGVIFENLVFIILLVNVIDKEEKLKNCLNVLIKSATVAFTFGIIELITGINVASSFLDTSSRDNILKSSYERFGSARAVFTFGHSIAFGVFCVAMLPIIIYSLTKCKNLYRGYISFLLCIGCLLMTMSRGPILVCIIMLFLIIFKMNGVDKFRFMKVLLSILFIAIIIIILVPKMRNVAIDSFLASLNALGAHFNVGNIGDNEHAVASRLVQLSMIPQVLNKYPLFGGGTGYIFNNSIYVYAADRVFKAVSIDMEYLRWLIDEGIVGFIGNAFLYVSILCAGLNKYRKYKDEILKSLLYSICGVLICYFTVAQLTTGPILWLLISFMVVRISQLERRSFN